MSGFLGPLEADGRVPPHQQTRVAAFLISAHGALARQFALALPLRIEAAWQTELNAQFYRESEIVSLLQRATTWVPDIALGYMAASWETAWLPPPIELTADCGLAPAVNLATLAHAVHAGSCLETPADSKLAMSRRMQQADSSSGHASAAPDPSPRRRSSCSSGCSSR